MVHKAIEHCINNLSRFFGSFFYSLLSLHKLNYRINLWLATIPLLLILVMVYPAVIGVNQYGAKPGFTF